MTIIEIVRIICAVMLGIIALIGVVGFLLLEISGFCDWYSDNHEIKEGGFMEFMIDNEDIFFEASLSSAICLLLGSFVVSFLFLYF